MLIRWKTRTYLKGTHWTFWPLVVLWSNGFKTGSPFHLYLLHTHRRHDACNSFKLFYWLKHLCLKAFTHRGRDELTTWKHEILTHKYFTLKLFRPAVMRLCDSCNNCSIRGLNRSMTCTDCEALTVYQTGGLSVRPHRAFVVPLDGNIHIYTYIYFLPQRSPGELFALSNALSVECKTLAYISQTCFQPVALLPTLPHPKINYISYFIQGDEKHTQPTGHYELWRNVCSAQRDSLMLSSAVQKKNINFY